MDRALRSAAGAPPAAFVPDVDAIHPSPLQRRSAGDSLGSHRPARTVLRGDDRKRQFVGMRTGDPAREVAAKQRAKSKTAPAEAEPDHDAWRRLDDARVLVRRHIDPTAPARLPGHATEVRKKSGNARCGVLEIGAA